MTQREVAIKRRSIGLSQRELSNLAGMNEDTIRSVEKMEHAAREATLQKIAAALAIAEEEYNSSPTNGDAVRNMNDEELVFFIACPISNCTILANQRDCYACKMKWLGEKVIRPLDENGNAIGGRM